MDVFDYVCEGQMSLFDFDKKPYKIQSELRVIELFAGIGSQLMGIKRLAEEGLLPHGYTSYKVVEFDKYAIASFNSIHNTNYEPMDITKLKGVDLEIVDTDKYTYLLTYSFPCQDLSIAGKGKGMAEGSDTRSSLLWEVRRLLDECENLPQILLMENVPQVHSKANMPHFQKWIDYLESKGYSNYYQDLNARDYGVAQNRNRCFMISLLGNYTYKFPKPFELDKCMADYLEDEVDDKYYLNNDRAKQLIDNLIVNGVLDDKNNA